MFGFGKRKEQMPVPQAEKGPQAATETRKEAVSGPEQKVILAKEAIAGLEAKRQEVVAELGTADPDEKANPEGAKKLYDLEMRIMELQADLQRLEELAAGHQAFQKEMDEREKKIEGIRSRLFDAEMRMARIGPSTSNQPAIDLMHTGREIEDLLQELRDLGASRD